MTLYEFLNCLHGVKKLANGEFIARCPAHEDKNPSLGIKQEGDHILITCYAGCQTETIVESMGLALANLFIKAPTFTHAQQASTPEKALSKIVKTYDYTNEAGQFLFQVVRYEPKAFKQRHQDDNGEWVWDLKGIKRVLYHLPGVLSCPNDQPLYLVEGEKDADNMIAKGLTATTSPGGANAWNPEYADYLKGKSLVIIPDKDSAGYAYAREIIKSLKGKSDDVSVIILPEGSKDVSDWLEAGGDVTKLALMEQDTSVLFLPDKIIYRLVEDRIFWDKSCEF